MPITGSVVRDALAAVGAVGKQIRSFDELAAGADAALRQAPPGLTAAGAASFLATCAQESAYFRTTVEYGTGQRYAPYIGRGFVQCTWEQNYRAFGAWCRGKGLVTDAAVFAKDPKALGDFRWAWATAVWYFESTRLWDWANAGDHRRVSQAVNGGRGRAGTSFTPNHWNERLKMFEAFRRAGNALLPGGTAAPAPTASAAASFRAEHGQVGAHIFRLAGFLNATFPAYSSLPLEPSPDQQRYGDQTAAVLREFAKRSGIQADGMNVGPQIAGALAKLGFRG